MSLRLWLLLNGTLENKGISFATITNDGATIDDNGKTGKCYSFSNTHIIIDSTDILNIFSSSSLPFSMSCWIYLNSDETDRVIIFGNYKANPFVNWELTASCVLRICVGGTSNYTTKTNATTVPKTVWTHIAVTYDGNTTTFYLNGMVAGTATGANTLSTKTASSRFYLGSDTRNDATRLKGKLNDFRLYDHCLSPAEVHEISLGLVCHYKLDDLYGVNILTSDPSLTLTGTANSVYSAYINLNPIIKNSNILLEGTTVTVVYDFTVNSLSANTKSTAYIYSQLNDNRLLPSISNTEILNRTNGIVIEEFLITADLAAYANDFRIRWRLLGNAASDSITIFNTRLFLGSLYESLYIKDSSGYGRKISLDFTSEYYLLRLDDPNYKLMFYEDYYDGGYMSDIFSSRTLSTNSPRYDKCINYKQGWQNDTTYESGIFGSIIITGLTVAAWINPSVATVHNNGIGFYTLSLTANTVKTFGIKTCNSGYFGVALGYGNSTSLYATTKVMPTNEWHHYAVTWENNSCKYYFDGELIYTRSITISTPIGLSNLGFIIGDCNTDGYTASYSDVRGYVTALSATDIKALYSTGAKVDNKGNLHTYEFNEKDAIKIKKSGIIYEKLLCELPILKKLKYDTNFYMEPDGSIWVRIYHHNNPSNGSFSSSNDFAHSVYIDTNRWFNVEVCDSLNQWEFMVKGKFTSTSDEWKIRWIQSVNPMTAAYTDVAAANVTKITTGGYSAYTSSWGGLYAKKGSAYLTTNNGNSGNWWGAVGSYSVYQSGIPGWGPSVTITTTGYNDLYVRIDNISTLSQDLAQFKKSGAILAHQFIER